MDFILFLLSFGFAALAVVVYHALFLTTREWTRLEGSVSGYVATPGIRGNLFNAIFRFQHHGKDHFIKDPMASPRPLYPIGKKVGIRASLASPTQFSVQSDLIKNGIHILAAFAVMFFGGGCFTFRGDIFSRFGVLFVVLPLYRILSAPFGRSGKLRDVLMTGFHHLLFPTPLSDDEVAMMNYVALESVTKAVASHRLRAHFVGILLILVGGAGIWGGESWLRHRKAFLQSACAAHGVVIRLEEVSDRKKATYAPVIRFRETASQQEFEFRHDYASTQTSYRAGEHVNVLYSAADPHHAMIDSGGAWNLWGPITILVFSFLLLVLGVKAAIR